MSDVEFIDGLNAKAPRDKAPDFVKASLSIKREALIAWLQQREGEWVNADIKESRGGKWYVAVDAWKPNSDGTQRQELRGSNPPRDALGRDQTPDFDDETIPF